jgi:hypothetical protein
MPAVPGVCLTVAVLAASITVEPEWFTRSDTSLGAHHLKAGSQA